jgi:hypothetical protein
MIKSKQNFAELGPLFGRKLSEQEEPQPSDSAQHDLEAEPGSTLV